MLIQLHKIKSVFHITSRGQVQFSASTLLHDNANYFVLENSEYDKWVIPTHTWYM